MYGRWFFIRYIRLSAQTFSSSLVTEAANRFPGRTSAFEISAIRAGASSPTGLQKAYFTTPQP